MCDMFRKLVQIEYTAIILYISKANRSQIIILICYRLSQLFLHGGNSYESQERLQRYITKVRALTISLLN